MRRQLAFIFAASIAGTVCGTAIEQDSKADVFLQEGRTILRYTQSGTLKVTESGTVDVLVVGGGGGGGQNSSYTVDSGGGAGGGGGGVVYKTSFEVVANAEPYQVIVGGGGAVGQNGGNSSVFGLTAYGGGGGARYATNGSTYPGKDGGSGGGSTRGAGLSTEATSGKAIYGAQGNIGNNGGLATHQYAPAGGGGAGGSGGNSSGTTPGTGGSGYECSILYVPFFATNTCYGGGGAGFRYNKTVAGGTGGGGPMKYTAGEAGIDGLGGGGCGGYKGGSGVVIIAFTPSSESRDRGWFAGTGGDESLTVRAVKEGRDEVRIFRKSDTLTLEGSGTIDVLAVGGGGGGGSLELNPDGGSGGGGAGGVVYCANLSVMPGTYAITVGDGGSVGGNGFATTGLGITAFGGGAGAASGKDAGPGFDGASGGGASWPTSNGSGGSTVNSGGAGIYSAYMNKGHAGGGSNHVYGGGGGGGAGEPGDQNSSSTSGNGGDGYPCSITGTSVYYGGGGSGYRGGVASKNSGGGLGGGGNFGHPGVDGFGGGGSGGQKGGSGIFIVRYRLKPVGMTIVVR